MLTEIDKNLWIAEGGAVPFLGIPYPTRMTVVRLADGSFWIHSPIQLDSDLVEQLQARGPVRYLISPNKLHHLFMGEWAERWPEARMYASPGLAKKRKDLRFHAELGDRPEPDWAEEIDR